MRSAIVITEEIDDIDLAVEELEAGIREQLGEFDSETVGFVVCDADVDTCELSRRLHDDLKIDIVGTTAVAIAERGLGYCDCAISLTVLTGDDVKFAVGSTEDISPKNVRSELKSAYDSASATLGCEPKIILLFAPFRADITCDVFMDLLDEFSSHAPIFGGGAGDSYELSKQSTFFNGEAGSVNDVRFLMIGGEVWPIFAMHHHFSGSIERKVEITSSEGSVVKTVDGETFVSFMKGIMALSEDDDGQHHVHTSTFCVELPDHAPDEEPVVRSVLDIDKETGSASFLTTMPVGAKMHTCLFQREDIAISATKTMDDIIERLKSDGRKRSVMLVSSCCIRNVLMGLHKDEELEIIRRKLADAGLDIKAIVGYMFGEYCPTKYADGVAKNRFHNLSFTVCAF